jgi:hypothetical protein
MWKRIVSGILGALSLFACLVASQYAIMAMEDFDNPKVSKWQAIFGESAMAFVAIAALALGIKFLHFAFSGRQRRGCGKWYSFFLGIACAIPGFFFSLPPAFAWAFYRRPNDIHADELAFEISCLVSLASAVTGCIVLLRKRPS